MAFSTIDGFTSTQTAGSGVVPFGTDPYDILVGTDFINSLKDTQQGMRYETLSGVLAGGVCTAALLVVTVPAGTVYVAGGTVWTNSGNETISVPDAATSYVWGCNDGLLRYTATTTAPTNFTNETACILTKAVAAAGVVTLDNSAQQQARVASHAARFVSENNLALVCTPTAIPAGAIGTIPANSQLNVDGGTFSVAGVLTIQGELRINA